MNEKTLYKLIMFSISLSFVGFICNVSIDGRLPLTKIGTILRLSGFFLQGGLYLKNKKIKKEHLLTYIGILFFFFLKLEKGIVYVLQLYLIIILLNKYKLRKIFKSFQTISIVGLILIGINYTFEISGVQIYYGIYDGIYQNRNTYGIVTPNILYGIFMCFILFGGLAKKSIKKYICLGILSGIAYKEIVSRNGFYISIIYIIMLILNEIISRKNMKKILIIGANIEILSIVMIIFGKNLLSRNIYKFFNEKLSDRLDLFNNFLKNITLYNFLGLTYIKLDTPLDNSFLIFYNYFGIGGILIFFTLLIYIFYKILYFKKIIDYRLLIYLLVTTIYYNFEAFMLNGGYLTSIGYFLIIYKSLKIRKKRQRKMGAILCYGEK